MTRTQRLTLFLMAKADASLHILYRPGTNQKEGFCWLGLDRSRWVRGDYLKPNHFTLARLLRDGLIEPLSLIHI